MNAAVSDFLPEILAVVGTLLVAGLGLLPLRPADTGVATRWELIVHGLLWLCICLSLCFVAPRFKRLFDDFGVELPGVSVFVIEHGVLLILLAPLVLIVDGVVFHRLRQRSLVQKSNAWSISMLAVPLVVFAVAALALGLPLMKLLSDLS